MAKRFSGSNWASLSGHGPGAEAETYHATKADWNKYAATHNQSTGRGSKVGLLTKRELDDKTAKANAPQFYPAKRVNAIKYAVRDRAAAKVAKLQAAGETAPEHLVKAATAKVREVRQSRGERMIAMGGGGGGGSSPS